MFRWWHSGQVFGQKVWLGSILCKALSEQLPGTSAKHSKNGDWIAQDLQNVVWQQDGARPNFERHICAFVDKEFLTWIVRRGSVDWSWNSPNISHCGVSTCYVIDENVYNKKLAYLFRVKESVLVEFKTLKKANLLVPLPWSPTWKQRYSSTLI